MRLDLSLQVLLIDEKRKRTATATIELPSTVFVVDCHCSGQSFVC